MATITITFDELDLLDGIRRYDGIEVESADWPAYDALATRGFITLSSKHGPQRKWRRAQLTDAGVLALNAPRCRYRHHKEYGEEIWCARCHGPLSCGPFEHGCEKCEAGKFRRCAVCNQPVLHCAC